MEMCSLHRRQILILTLICLGLNLAVATLLADVPFILTLPFKLITECRVSAKSEVLRLMYQGMNWLPWKLCTFLWEMGEPSTRIKKRAHTWCWPITQDWMWCSNFCHNSFKYYWRNLIYQGTGNSMYELNLTPQTCPVHEAKDLVESEHRGKCRWLGSNFCVRINLTK